MGFSRPLVEANLRDARERLASGSPDSMFTAFLVFSDALMAAGWSRALGEPEEQWRSLLATASDSTEVIFRERAKRSHDDTSPANPDTYVSGVYAAMVANRTTVLDFLATIPPKLYHSDLVEVSPELDHVSAALQAVLANDLTGARLHINRAREVRATTPDVSYWVEQAHALGHAIDRDVEQFEEAINLVNVAMISCFIQEEADENGPDVPLQLPVLGLRAIMARLSA